MIRLCLAATLVVLPSFALAADATAPVREIMETVTKNWADVADDNNDPPPYVDYFNDEFLQRLYSKDFVGKYREAAKYPAYEDGDSPFDYDVIAMGQDGCSLKDLKIEAQPPVGGVTMVRTTFDNTHCFGEREPDWKPAEVDFNVVEEDGKAVIDDILRPQDGDPGSLKTEMQAIAKEGANPTPDDGEMQEEVSPE
ncbi:hypothetical protein OCK02_14455 [Rhizobium sp. TRM96647]|uniref:hypothetical protein n=1 Tax=unclassified Rhizobium TaxID=2613769 RepID=UPI001E475765|nr:MULTISPECIES: hypothetical protein [unclassified Rhizobium]MCD2182053.1 hypothetical protein [Rhizobium sp. GN54]MCV3737414.1 hypothetical protein [Rhizobium sp. TRM96647]MCV3756496.1 hypothetical protein [Rhizobium sp. TRM96650]